VATLGTDPYGGAKSVSSAETCSFWTLEITYELTTEIQLLTLTVIESEHSLTLKSQQFKFSYVSKR